MNTLEGCFVLVKQVMELRSSLHTPQRPTLWNAVPINRVLVGPESGGA